MFHVEHLAVERSLNLVPTLLLVGVLWVGWKLRFHVERWLKWLAALGTAALALREYRARQQAKVDDRLYEHWQRERWRQARMREAHDLHEDAS